MDCTKDQHRSTLRSEIWVISACVFTWTPWYKQTSHVFLGRRRTSQIEPLLKGNLCCSVTLGLQNQHPVHVQCFTVIFEAFWKCVTEFKNPAMMGWGIQLSHFFVGRKDHPQDWTSSYLCSIPTYSLYLFSLSSGQSQLLSGGSGL